MRTSILLSMAAAIWAASSVTCYADFSDIKGIQLGNPQERIAKSQLEALSIQREQLVLQKQMMQAGQNYNNVIFLNQSGNNNYLNLNTNQASSATQGVQNGMAR